MSTVDAKERPKGRRRWPWVLLAVTMILIGGPIAWRFGPLNATEKTLVGSWRPISDLPVSQVFRLATDRSYTETWTIAGFPDTVTTGNWTASESSIHFTVDEITDTAPLPWHRRIHLAVVTHFRRPSNLRLDGPDRFWKDNTEFVRLPDWQSRTPQPTLSAAPKDRRKARSQGMARKRRDIVGSAARSPMSEGAAVNYTPFITARLRSQRSSLFMVTASESCSSSDLTKSNLKRIYEGLYDVALKKVTEGRDGRTWSYNVDNIPPQPLCDRVGEVVPDQFVVSVHLWYGLALWSDVKKDEWLLEVPYGVPVKTDGNGTSTFTIESKRFVGTKATGWVRKS